MLIPWPPMVKLTVSRYPAGSITNDTLSSSQLQTLYISAVHDGGESLTFSKTNCPPFSFKTTSPSHIRSTLYHGCTVIDCGLQLQIRIFTSCRGDEMNGPFSSTGWVALSGDRCDSIYKGGSQPILLNVLHVFGRWLRQSQRLHSFEWLTLGKWFDGGRASIFA
jgi:hypothetical protein